MSDRSLAAKQPFDRPIEGAGERGLLADFSLSKILSALPRKGVGVPGTRTL